jgi:hypothetical protein
LGEIFYALNAGGVGTGTAAMIDTCILQDTAAPTPGCMSIGFTQGGVTSYVSKLTNKWLFDFTGGDPGGNADTGDVWDWEAAQNNLRYVANYFDDTGNVVLSGTANTAVDLGLIDNS